MPASPQAISSNRKVFAMLVKGALVVKLARPKVDALVAKGLGTHFGPGHGKPMKEWLCVLGRREDWLSLALSARKASTSARAS